MDLIAGVVDQSTVIRAMTGTGPLSGKVAADFTIWYRRGGAKVPISLSDLNAVDDAHSDGGIIEIDAGWYRLDLPDDAVASGSASVAIGGSVAGGVVLSAPIGLKALAEVVVSSTSAMSAAATSSGELTITRYSTFRVQLTGLGSLVGRSDLVFTVKTAVSTLASTADSSAIIQVSENDGLLYIAGAAAGDSSLASLTVDDEDAGDVTIYIDEVATGLLSSATKMPYSLKKLVTGGDDSELTSVDYASRYGTTTYARVLEAVTRKV